MVYHSFDGVQVIGDGQRVSVRVEQDGSRGRLARLRRVG